MRTKFGLLSVRSVLIVLVVVCGYVNAGISAQNPPASLQLSLVYPSNGILMPGQSQVVQVAAAIQPPPGIPIHAYRLMIKVRRRNGSALLCNSFYPTKPNSLAKLDLKNLLPGDYALTAQLDQNGSVITASQNYRIEKTRSASPTVTPTPTATPTATRTAIATVSKTATPTATSTRVPTASATVTATKSPTATATKSSTPTASATATSGPTSTASPAGESVVNTTICHNLGARSSVTCNIAAPAAGNALVVHVSQWYTNGTALIKSVTDNRGDRLTQVPTLNFYDGFNFVYGQFYETNIPSGVTSITVTPGSSTTVDFVVDEISGMQNTSPVDQYASRSAASTAISSGTSATLAEGGELAEAGCELGGGSSTTMAGPSNGYSGNSALAGSTIVGDSGETDIGVMRAFNIVGSAGTGTAWTWSSSSSYGCGVAVYKPAVVPSPTPTANATVTPTATASSGPSPTSTPGGTPTSGTPTPTGAPTPTGTGTRVAIVASTPAMTNVNRIGVNLGNQGQYGESDFMQNMFDNPGFELGQECWAWIVGTSHSSSGFNTTNDNGEATGFWNGAAGSVRAGTSAGTTLTVGTFTAGGTFTCSGSCPTLNTGDVVAACQTGPSVAGLATSQGGWGLGSDGKITISTAQKYEGASSMAYDVSAGGSESATFGWDTATTLGGVCSDNITSCTVANQAADCAAPLSGVCSVAPYANAGPWHPVKGSFEISLYALASGTSGGTPTVSVSLIRSGGTNVSHTFTLTNDGAWHQYTFPFTGTDTAASAKNVLSYTQTASNGTAQSGAKIYVDDVYLGRAESSPTGFRDEVVASLQTLNVGSLRYMIPLTLDQNDANFEGPASCTPGATAAGGCDFLKGPSSDYTGTGSFQWGWYFASRDVYALANAVNAVPWVSIPNTFSDADLQQFAKNACTAMSTYNFPSLWIEQSNEDWNGAGPGAKFDAHGQYYGEVAGRNFNVIASQANSSCASLASRIHYVIGNQTCNDGVVYEALAGATAAGYPIPNTAQYGADDATYNAGGTTFAGVLPDLSGSLASQAAQYATYFAEFPPDYLYGGSANCIANDQSVLGSNNTISAYESGVGAGSGPGVGTTEQSYLSQAGFPSAMWMPEDWLLGIQALMPVQNAFTFAQVEFGDNPAYQNPQWGVIHDLDSDFGAPFPHIRPVGLGMSVMNSAIGGNYYPVDTSAMSNIYANAFENGGNWSAVLTNAGNSNVPITLQFPSGGTLPTSANTVLYTHGITDDNEDSNSVTIGPLPGGVSVSGNSLTLTLPPFSVVALPPQ